MTSGRAVLINNSAARYLPIHPLTLLHSPIGHAFTPSVLSKLHRAAVPRRAACCPTSLFLLQYPSTIHGFQVTSKQLVATRMLQGDDSLTASKSRLAENGTVMHRIMQRQYIVPNRTALDYIDNGNTSRKQVICDHFGHSGNVCFLKVFYVDGWKYISAYSAGDELYDLHSYPYELANRICDRSTFDRQCKMRALIIKHYEERRTEREHWHPQEFREQGIIYSSPEWPRDETLHLYQLKVQQMRGSPHV